MIKALKNLTKEQKRKFSQELVCIAFAILGAVIFILNILKIVPEDYIVAQFFIAYGFVVGPAFALLGIAAFFETRKIRVKKFRKKAR